MRYPYDDFGRGRGFYVINLSKTALELIFCSGLVLYYACLLTAFFSKEFMLDLGDGVGTIFGRKEKKPDRLPSATV